MQPATARLIEQGGMKKGDVLAVAQVAGVMAAKRTPDLIPLCHPLPISGVSMAFELDAEQARLEYGQPSASKARRASRWRHSPR